MAKKKSVFKGYTEDEVMAAEASSYFIQVGSEIFNSKGIFCFNRRSAVIYYNRVLRQVLYQLQNGTKKEKKNAARVLNNLKIQPLRLH